MADNGAGTEKVKMSLDHSIQWHVQRMRRPFTLKQKRADKHDNLSAQKNYNDGLSTIT